MVVRQPDDSVPQVVGSDLLGSGSALHIASGGFVLAFIFNSPKNFIKQGILYPFFQLIKFQGNLSNLTNVTKGLSGSPRI